MNPSEAVSLKQSCFPFPNNWATHSSELTSVPLEGGGEGPHYPAHLTCGRWEPWNPPFGDPHPAAPLACCVTHYKCPNLSEPLFSCCQCAGVRFREQGLEGSQCCTLRSHAQRAQCPDTLVCPLGPKHKHLVCGGLALIRCRKTHRHRQECHEERICVILTVPWKKQATHTQGRRQGWGTRGRVGRSGTD